MSDYKMIALDMDGTILNAKKELSPAVMNAIRDAQNAGKYVVLSTGRCISEMQPQAKLLEQADYAVLESGAIVYRGKDKQILKQSAFDPESVREVLRRTRGSDALMYGFVNGLGYIMHETVEKMPEYHMWIYQPMYEQYANFVEDISEYFLEHIDQVEKILFYHKDETSRKQMKKDLQDLPIVLAYSEVASLEVSPKGIDKGETLRWLCHKLNIKEEEMIAVGDADNDLSMLRLAGFPIAMGNANEHVKEIAKAQVADNNHDGVAEAIWKYLI